MNKSNFTKYYKEPKEKYNIVSTVIFRIIDNYKPFDHYYTGLKHLVDNLPVLLPKYYLRLYYDDTISVAKSTSPEVNKEITTLWIPYFEELKKKEHVQLCHYKHKLNDGLFGTLVRFYPLFDYQDNANIDHVIISDVDIENTEPLTALFPRMLKFMEDNKTDVHYLASHCYTRMTRYNVFSDDEIKDRSLPFVANCIISKIKFPKKLFKDFMTCMENLDQEENGNETCKKTQNFVKNEKTANKVINTKTKFLYGIDEFFLYVAISKYIKEMKIHCSYTYFNNARIVLRNIYTASDNFKDEEKYKPFVKDILGKFYNERKSLKDNFNNFTFKVVSDNLGMDKLNEKQRHYFDYTFTNIKNIFSKMPTDNNKLPFNLKKADVECILDYPEFKLIDAVLA